MKGREHPCIDFRFGFMMSASWYMLGSICSSPFSCRPGIHMIAAIVFSSLGLCTLVYSCFFESPKCLRCLRNRESSFYCCNGELSLTTSARRCTARCELKGTRPSWCGQLCSCANSTHPNLCCPLLAPITIAAVYTGQNFRFCATRSGDPPGLSFRAIHLTI